MKHFLLLLMMLGAAASSSAQPVHTYELDPSLYGSTANTVRAFYVEAGPAGANQTWDFSMISTFASIDISILNPDDTPFASSYPEADFAVFTEFSNADEYLFSDIQDDGIYSMGVELLNNFPYSATYTNTRRNIASPLSYEQTYSDSAFAEVATEGITGTISSSLVVEVDGYGTLITPDGTFENVLRLHSIETAETIATMGGGEHFITQGVLDTYAWVIDGYPIPIMYTQIETSGGQVVGQDTEYLANTSVLPLSLKNQTLDGISLYPVPATDYITLDLGENEIGQGQIRVFDVKGALLQAYQLNAWEQQKVIDVNDLPAGLYSLQIETRDGMATKRLVVE